MSVNDTGRFCNNCNQSVIDFTTYGDQQLADFFKRSKGNVCGQFRNDQLEKPLYALQYSQNRPFPPFLISVAMAIGLGNNASAKSIQIDPQVVHAEISGEKKEMKNSPIAGDGSMYYVSGKIIDKATGEGLPGTVIQIGRSAVGTASDKQGFFKLMIPFHSLADTVKLIISCYGYSSETLNIPARDFPVHTIVELELSPVEESVVTVMAYGISGEKRVIYGGVCREVTPDAVDESKAIVKKKHSFLQKIKRWFRIKRKKND
jgi:hypothetical protein